MHEDTDDYAGRRPKPGRLQRAGLCGAALASVAALIAACSGGSGGNGGSGGSSPSGSAVMGQALKYSQCMRSHGIADFPDPNSQGQIVLSVSGPNSDLAPTNPRFKVAEGACKSLQPSGGTPAQKQQNYTAELKYAHCMQARGVAVPDPKAPGSGAGSQGNSSGSGSAGNGVNPNSPQFIVANKACQHYLPAGSGPSLSRGGS